MLEISYCRLKSSFFFACGAHRFKTMFKDDIHPKNPPVIADNYVDVLVVCLAAQVNNRRGAGALIKITWDYRCISLSDGILFFDA